MSSKVRDERCRLVILLLAERWPLAFFPLDGPNPPKPLAVSIREALLAALPDALGLKSALGLYCGCAAYRRASVPGAIRVDLNGEPAGVVTDDEVEGVKAKRHAARLERRAKRAAKRKLTKVAQPKPLAEPVAEITMPSVEHAPKRVVSAWKQPPSRARPADLSSPRFSVEVKRRRVVLSARDRWEHGR